MCEGLVGRSSMKTWPQGPVSFIRIDSFMLDCCKDWTLLHFSLLVSNTLRKNMFMFLSPMVMD